MTLPRRIRSLFDRTLRLLLPGHSLISNEALQTLKRKKDFFGEMHALAVALMPSFGLPILAESRYSILTIRNDQPLLLATHNGGLFSCFTTILWAIHTLHQNGEHLPQRINNQFGMNLYKSHFGQDTYHHWFAPPDAADLNRLTCLEPPRHRHDHHGDYELAFDGLGSAWLEAYLRCYMRPSPALQERINQFQNNYQLCDIPTLAVYIRGTDKHKEVAAKPLHVYTRACDAILQREGIERLLIQTDQEQIRNHFLRRYRSRCIFIRELPVTSGRVGIHFLHRATAEPQDRATLDLLAMCYALASCSALLTSTNNVASFLSHLARLNGHSVEQIR